MLASAPEQSDECHAVLRRAVHISKISTPWHTTGTVRFTVDYSTRRVADDQQSKIAVFSMVFSLIVSRPIPALGLIDPIVIQLVFVDFDTNAGS